MVFEPAKRNPGESSKRKVAASGEAGDFQLLSLPEYTPLAGECGATRGISDSSLAVYRIFN